jgi:hypothetical protein
MMTIFKHWIFTDGLQGACPTQDNLFTPKHKKFFLTVKGTNRRTHKSKLFSCTYQYAPAYTTFKSGDGVLAIINDAQAALEGSVEAFRDTFGYDNTPDAARAYKACKRALDFLTSLGMSPEDIDAAREALDS